jgi:poly [ADP-ribose] polymerase
MRDYAYLVFVDGYENHNKFYEMKENDDGSIDVNYGRVGTSSMTHHYAPYEKSFYNLKRSKESKGYKDVTALHSQIEKPVSDAKAEDQSFKPIDDPEVNAIIQSAIDECRQFMQANYTVSISKVTKKMVDEAAMNLHNLSKLAKNPNNISEHYLVQEFNDELKALYEAIPRRMGNVSDCFAKSSSEFYSIIEKEEDMLDIVRNQVVANTVPVKVSEDKNINVLENYDLDMSSDVTFAEEDYIIDKMAKKNWEKDSCEDRFLRAFKVTNKETEKAFNDYCEEHHLKDHHGIHSYFHGTRFENIWSIMKTGLTLNPNAVITGKAFGQGIYFAEHSKKALGYTSINGSRWAKGGKNTGMLLMYKVAVGKSYVVYNTLGSSFKKDSLEQLSRRKGEEYLSVYAPGKSESGKGAFLNSEIMVYDDRACTIQYMVEVSSYDRNYTLGYKDRKGVDFHKGLSFDDKTRTATLDMTVAEDKTKNFFEKLYGSLPVSVEMTYDEQYDKITVKTFDETDDRLDVTLTGADLSFISGRIKRVYADSEKEWRVLCDKKIEQQKSSQKEEKNKPVER